MMSKLRRRIGAPVNLAPKPLPRWFEIPLAAVVVAVAVYGLVGVVLAMLGRFDPAVAALGGCLVGSATAIGLWSRDTRQAGTAATMAAAGMVAAAVLIGVFNMSHNTETLLTGRDPGVYVTTGLWLADHDDLTPDIELDTFGGHEDLTFAPPGFTPTADGGRALHPQFPHLFGALIAAGAEVGGVGGAVKTTALLGALAVLMIFALGARLTHPLLSAAGALGYGLGYPFTHFSRTATSEIAAQVLIFGGAWLLLVSRNRPWLRLLAGLAVGSATAVRIDALVAAFGVLAFLCWELLAARRRGWNAVRTALAPFVATIIGLASAGAIALIDTRDFSPGYFISLESRVDQIMLAGIAVLLLTGVALVAWPLLERIGVRVQRAHVAVAASIGAATAGLLFYGHLARPHFNVDISPQTTENGIAFMEALQRDAGLPLDASRSYFELSARWVEMYLGPVPAIAAAIAVGATVALAVFRPRAEWLLFLGVILPLTALYLWNPQIYPDHPWAMRRYVLVTLPAAALLVAVAAGWLGNLSTEGSWLRTGGRLVAAGLLIAMIGTSIHQSSELPSAEGRPLSGITDDVCDTLKGDSAVVVTPETRTERIPMVRLGHEYAATISVACDVPVGIATESLSAADLARIESATDASGRRLIVASSEPLSSVPAGHSAQPLLQRQTRVWFLLRQLNTRSTTVIPYEFSLYLTQLNPRSAA